MINTIHYLYLLEYKPQASWIKLYITYTIWKRTPFFKLSRNTVLILSVLQPPFKLINRLSIPLKLLTLKDTTQWVQLPAKLQTHFKAVTTKLVIHLRAYRCEEERV